MIVAIVLGEVVLIKKNALSSLSINSVHVAFQTWTSETHGVHQQKRKKMVNEKINKKMKVLKVPFGSQA